MNEQINYSIVGAGSVEVSDFAKIGDGVKFIFHEPARIRIGDYCTIGAGVKVVSSGGDVVIADWTSLHDNCLVISGAYVEIGEHCWFGQNSVLDGTGGLKIGKGVRVGMYSQIWSHAAGGEQIEGCTLIRERPVEIEDDVWLVGSCIVASGVRIGRRTIALSGSNITKSWPENSVIVGSPAAIKPNLSYYKVISLEEKWGLINSWIDSAANKFFLNIERIASDVLSVTSAKYDGKVVFVKMDSHFEIFQTDSQVTICSIESKKYKKCLTVLEGILLKFLEGNKARFYLK